MSSTRATRARLVSLPLRGPLTLVLLSLVIITTVSAGWIAYRAAYRSVEDEALAGLSSLAAARDNELGMALARKRERVQSSLQSLNFGCGITGVMVPTCAREMLRPFLRHEQAYGAFLSYAGRPVAHVGKFLGSGQATVSSLPLPQAGQEGRSYVTLRHADTESGLALAVDFSLAGLVSTTERLRASTRVVTRLADKDVVDAATGSPQTPLPVGELNRCYAGSEGWAIHDQQYIWFRPSRAIDQTCVISLRAQQEILAPMSRLRARIVRLGVIFGAIALVLAYFLGWWLARPIVRLRQRVRDLRQGDYDSPVPLVGVGEVRELAHAFALMKDSVKAYRETIAENERRLGMVYKAARLWIWEYDLVYGEMSWQEPAAGRAPKKTTLRRFLRRVHREDRHIVCDAIRKAKVTGIYEAEYRINKGERTLVWMSSWGQIIGLLQRKMIGVSLEITARKNAENLIRDKDRLEASADIAGALAHEINNPLTAILGALFMLDKEHFRDPAAAHYVDIAEQQTRRVAQLVKQILGVYHKPTARVPIDLQSLLEDVVAGCRPEAQAKGQQLLLTCEHAVINGCRAELAHAFGNILQNAVESSPSESGIRVRAHLAHRWSGDGTGVRVLIADSGPGIAADDLPRVFDAFTGTKAQRGSGLGLWVARSIIVKHDGTIRIRVAHGKQSGTVVSIFLPVVGRSKPVHSADIASTRLGTANRSAG